MRRGRVFRRCTSCHRRVKGRRCSCGHGQATWAFVVDLNPPGEPRRQKMGSGFQSEADATAAMNRLQADRAEGLYVEPRKLTAAAYLRDWIKNLEAPHDPGEETDAPGEVRDWTLTGWEVAVRRHLIPRLGLLQLQQLTRPQIRAAYRDIRASGRKDGGPLSPKTVWNVHLCLHRALQDAIREGLIRTNPADRAARKPKSKPEINYWVGAELARFLVSVTDVNQQTLYRVAGQTGMRLGELLGLRWHDVDFTAGRISIQQQLTRRRSGGYQFAEPKTAGSRRTIDASADTLEALRAHQAQQEIDRRNWADAYVHELDLVFCREDGSRLDPTQVGKKFSAAVGRTNLTRLRFHDLRHSSAVIGLRELGEWPDETSARLGHSSVAFTLETYGHLLPARGRAIAAAFDRLLREAVPA
jgi:integrase